MNVTIRHDEAAHQFILRADGVEGTLQYAVVDAHTVDFVSTYIPHALRGRQLGSRLVCHALDWARERGLRVVPSCWFVGPVAARHPEYAAVLVS